MSGKHIKHGWKALKLKIDGMHCANCEVLIERRFKKISGVRRVKVSHVTGRAEVTMSVFSDAFGSTADTA